MLFNMLVVGGFVTAWVIMMGVMAWIDYRLRRLEGRFAKIEGLWRT